MAHVYTSAVIPATVTDVWHIVRNFNGLPNWHPAVIECHIESNRDINSVGCIRCFKQRSGDIIRERLMGLDDSSYVQTYSIIEAPLAVSDYRARLRLQRISENNTTFATWTANFNCSPSDETRIVDDLDQLFLEGLVALRSCFAG